MTRQLVICIDGTWNKPENNIQKNTNVCKIHQYLLKTIDHDNIKYIKGVGAEGNALQRAFEGYTGTGTTENILEAYKFLIEKKYDASKDQLFLFGFSRGAFAVRSLAGLIRNCGVLRSDKQKLMKDAYEIYRSDKKEHHPDNTENFRQTNSNPNSTKVHFIGVWDTVGSLGNPLLPDLLISRYSKFHDTKLSSEVSHAYQALAICERRWLFSPCLWKKQLKDNGQPENKQQNIEQVWFIGAHANIGGGYRKEALSNSTLLWMIEKAKAAGLSFPKVELNTTEDIYIYDETYKKPHYKIKRAERDICAYADSKEVQTFEAVHDSVIRIVRKEIPVQFEDPAFKMNKLHHYLKKAGIHS